METFEYPSFPPHISRAHVLLYKNVKNAADLRRRIIAAATSPNESDRDAVNFAFVDPRLVSTSFPSFLPEGR